jgi:hypothetical protein
MVHLMHAHPISEEQKCLATSVCVQNKANLGEKITGSRGFDDDLENH